MTAVASQESAPPASDARPRAEHLQLADGVELIGRLEGSGFRNEPHLARRSDGQIVQLTKLLFSIAALSDGHRDADTVAQILTHASNRQFTGEQVQGLVERRLRPVGVLAEADGTSPPVPKREALMALRHRRPILSEDVVNVVARPFMWLHQPIVVVEVLLGLLAFDVWLFAFHGVAAGLRSAIYHPELLLVVMASVVVATAFHEIGHASACRYSGARPGVMGVGFYLVYPAFYCDVTDAYRLNRAGRLRTDLGGVYFNSIFALLAGGVYFLTGEEVALLAAAVQHLILLQQLLPLMRFDGYYVLTDLTGVPDILSRIKPILRSLVRGRDNEPKVAELKPWVRVAVTAYLLALVPTLLLLFVFMVLSAPRVLATVVDSLGIQLGNLQDAERIVDYAVVAVGILALVLPVAAIALSITRVGQMTGRGLMRWSRGSAWRTVVATIAASAILGAVVYAWWPNDGYEPIRQGERGTIGEVIDGMSSGQGTVRGNTEEPSPGEGSLWTPDGTDGAPGQPVKEDGSARDVRNRSAGVDTDDREATEAPSEGTTTEPTATTAPAPSETTATDPATTDAATTDPATTDPTTTDPATTPSEPTTDPTSPTAEPTPTTTDTTSTGTSTESPPPEPTSTTAP